FQDVKIDYEPNPERSNKDILNKVSNDNSDDYHSTFFMLLSDLNFEGITSFTQLSLEKPTFGQLLISINIKSSKRLQFFDQNKMVKISQTQIHPVNVQEISLETLSISQKFSV
ncbi:9959_t:CDS:2, partial [Funneliformis geosporum]